MGLGEILENVLRLQLMQGKVLIGEHLSDNLKWNKSNLIALQSSTRITSIFRELFEPNEAVCYQFHFTINILISKVSIMVLARMSRISVPVMLCYVAFQLASTTVALWERERVQKTH